MSSIYLIPLPKKPLDATKPWYTMTPVGKNKLNSLLKEMCAKAGLSKDFTNHSLWAYGTTTLFQAKVPEKLIQMRTGHKPIEALRSYERTSETQLLDVSHVVVIRTLLRALAMKSFLTMIPVSHPVVIL